MSQGKDESKRKSTVWTARKKAAQKRVKSRRADGEKSKLDSMGHSCAELFILSNAFS